MLHYLILCLIALIAFGILTFKLYVAGHIVWGTVTLLVLFLPFLLLFIDKVRGKNPNSQKNEK